MTLSRPRNDPAQYDDLAGEWWDPMGQFAMLHWLAASRAALIPTVGTGPSPTAPPSDSQRVPVLVDVACGGGLLAPYVAKLGYRHVGVDIGHQATRVAGAHGVDAVRGDARALPFADASADVVVAGEVLEHVPGLPEVVGEVCRVLRPGGTVVLDTIAATRLAGLLAVTVAERIPGGPPVGLHDRALFVDRRQLRDAFAAHGVTLTLRGLQLPAGGYLRWLAARRRGGPAPDVRLRTSRHTGVLFQAHGTKPG